MRSVPSGITAHLAGNSFSLCRAFTVTRKDGTVIRFAETQSSFVLPGVGTFLPARGIRVSSIPFQLNAGTQTNAFDMEISSEAAGIIDPDDVLAGYYTNAAVVASVINHANPAQGKLDLRRGFFGEISRNDAGLVNVQVIGLMSKAKDLPIEHYEPLCRTYLGHPRCGIALGPLTKTSTVVSASGYSVVVSGVSSSKPLALGQLAPTAGPWTGSAFEIRAWNPATQTITLFLPVGALIEAGTPVSITPGCDFTRSMCRDVYNNRVNFQGEDDIPGEDAVSINYEAWGA